jgi:predicted TIM-barrel fold metal-dependent hydrolase
MGTDRKRTGHTKAYGASRAVWWARTHSTDAARRTWLRKLASLGAVPILNGCNIAAPDTSQGPPASPPREASPSTVPSPAPAPVPTSVASAPHGGPPTAYIDIHCHIFNARDVPTYSFVEDVFLENEILRVLGAPMVLLITQIAARTAPTYQRERDALDHPKGGPYLTAASLDFPSDEVIFSEGFKAFLRDDTAFTDDQGRVEKLEKDRFVRQLYEIFLPGRIEPGVRFESEAIEDKNVSDLFQALQDARKRKGNGIVEYTAQFLTYFAIRVAYPRFRLALELGTLSPDAGTPRLLTPSTLDIENWLSTARAGAEPTPPTRLAEQSELMRLIALQPRPSLVHGFIAFDPWRYADDVVLGRSPDALKIVDVALKHDGFIGVKLYPPMGFRAAGNVRRSRDDFPEEFRRRHANNPGRALDDALACLYAYCVENDVPIMAHCAATNGTNLKNARCADPVFWHEVLNNPKFRTLRLNLGHFGAVWNLDKTVVQASDDVSWTGYIVRMIEDNDFPNLYTDFGDFGVVLGRSDKELEQRKTIFEKLHSLVLDPKNTKIRSRLMYGSDWLLLGREPGFEAYYAQVHDYLLQELGTSPDEFFWKNAAGYLGLAQGDKTRDRLRKFYLDNQRDPAVLDPFQP